MTIFDWELGISPIVEYGFMWRDEDDVLLGQTSPFHQVIHFHDLGVDITVVRFMGEQRSFPHNWEWAY